jgi:D-glycero-alpha-D-manno-heptose-7-phosphate kinase
MIISRTPFRVSFCGGGSDLPSFYTKHGGCVLSTGIDKYMYISVHPSFDPDTTALKYSKTETVTDIEDIEHAYFKDMLKRFDVKGVELTSTADVPAGTGLGSSSSFTVGVLHALYAYTGKYVSKERLAEEACEVELVDLQQPIGKQDQYGAAFGGLNFYNFNKDGSVFVEPILMEHDKYKQLQDNLLMFYTGDVRSASAILKEQGGNVTAGDKEQNQLRMCELTYDLRRELNRGNIDSLGEILDESWQLKRTLASGISNPQIDEYYEIAMKNGAIGGKLLGAGGGGFLLFYVKENNQDRLREALGLPEMPFRFDGQGSTIIYVGQKTHVCTKKK